MKICESVSVALSIVSSSAYFIHAGTATPHVLIKGLVEELSRLKNVEVIHLHTGEEGSCHFSPGLST